MIWSRGELLPDEALHVSVLDRTFEHGLGLFETFRTWNGRAPLLDRHLERMASSADALGLPIDRETLPDETDVLALVRAEGFEADAMIRITLSGGLSATSGSSLWMRAAAIPEKLGDGGAILDDRFLLVDREDPLARHKTLNYWRRRLAFAEGQHAGFHERLTQSPDGHVWEGTRTNLFLFRDGVLHTPTPDGPVLPGIMRALVLERARGINLRTVECEVDSEMLVSSDEVFLTNSVRGLVPVAVLFGRRRFEAPGPRTRCIEMETSEWLKAERSGV